MSTAVTHLTVDEAFEAKMQAEALEQDAYEAYQCNSTFERWLAHQGAVTQREKAHAYYLDRLIEEQARLSML